MSVEMEKRCPHCGAESMDIIGNGPYWPACTYCGVQGNAARTKDDAIKLWKKHSRLVSGCNRKKKGKL